MTARKIGEKFGPRVFGTPEAHLRRDLRSEQPKLPGDLTPEAVETLVRLHLKAIRRKQRHITAEDAWRRVE